MGKIFIMGFNIIKKPFYKKNILSCLKILILFIILFVNKQVYTFRVNQEMILKLFIIIILTLLIIKYLETKEISRYRNRLNLPISLFVLMMSISLLRVKVLSVGLGDYEIFISYFLLYFLIINNVDKKEQFDSFIKLFYLTSFLVSLYTLMQYYGFEPYLKDFHSLTSTIGQKNWISNYIGMFFPVTLIYFLLEDIKKNKIVYYILLSILYATMMICQSRGIWISIAFTILIGIFLIYRFKLFALFNKENQKWLVVLIITFMIITIIYSTDNPLNKSAITVSQRAVSTFNEQDPSINTRLLMWKTTFEMIKDKPIFGSGIGTFKMNYLNYQAEFLKNNPYYIRYSVKAGEAHNEYLQMWAELGIIGLGIFIGVILMLYSLILDYLKKNNTDQDKIIVFGLVLGITCFLIHSLFTFPLYVPALGVTFFTLVGLTVIYTRKINLPKTDSNNGLKELKLKNKVKKIALTILVLVFMIGAINLVAVKSYIAKIKYFNGMRHNVDGNYKEALPYLEQAASLYPYNGRILHALGTTYYNLGILNKAEEILHRTTEYLIDAKTFYNLGLVYSQAGLYSKAEEKFKYALYLNPKYDKAYHELGYLYFTQGKYDDTIEQWNKILEIEPDFPNKYIVLNNLGIVYNKKEMPEKALEYFLQALQLVPEGDPIEKEIEEEINKIYKSSLENKIIFRFPFSRE